MFDFNHILAWEEVDAANVSLMFHNTNAQPLRDMLPYLAKERRDIFDAYQKLHSSQAGATLKNRPLVAVFLPLPNRCYLFEGLYAVAGWQSRPTREIYADPAYGIISGSYGDPASDPERNMSRMDEQDVFDLAADNRLQTLRGRVVVPAPGGRAYVRIASKTSLEIVQIYETSGLEAPPPDWRALAIKGAFVRNMPGRWAERLRGWRGVYLIVDETDGARYVGSAYGQDNLLGRWRAHVAKEAGITAELRRRDPANFRFTILERVSPDMPGAEVIELERGWMRRLHTVEHGLNS